MQSLFRNVHQQAGNWYVLDDEFPWDVRSVKEDLFSLIKQRNVPVVFCDTCEVNYILSSLGEEEEEFLYPIHGLYHKESRIVFICAWAEYEQLLETLLHEFRHDMQHTDNMIYRIYEEQKLSYEHRWIERDARAFAQERIALYYRMHQ